MSAPHTVRLIALRHLLLRPVQDGPHETPEWVDDGVPFLSVDGIVDNHLKFDGCRYVSSDAYAEYSRKSKPQRGDVLLTKAASIGKVAVVDTDMEFNVWSPLAILRPDPTLLDSRFLYFALQATGSQDQLQTSSTKNTQQNVAMSDIGELRIIAPAVIAQRAIADYLDRKTAQIDALIAAKRRMGELLQQKFQGAVSRVTKAQIVIDADLPLSDGWRRMALRRCLRAADYGIGEASQSQGIYAVLGMSNIAAGEVTEPSGGFVMTVDKSLLLMPGDLLFNRTNSRELVGKVGLVKSIQRPTTFASYLVRLRVNDAATPEYLNYLLNSPEVLGLARSMALPSIGQANLNPSRYSAIILPIPPTDEQHRLAAHLDGLASRIQTMRSAIERQISLLIERRQALITAAVTGQLNISESA